MSEIYHHGILGQKWGKKNGPPYPLDAGSSHERGTIRQSENRVKRIVLQAARGGSKIHGLFFFRSRNIHGL